MLKTDFTNIATHRCAYARVATDLQEFLLLAAVIPLIGAAKLHLLSATIWPYYLITGFQPLLPS
jgi:hypothetical protein